MFLCVLFSFVVVWGFVCLLGPARFVVVVSSYCLLGLVFAAPLYMVINISNMRQDLEVRKKKLGAAVGAAVWDPGGRRRVALGPPLGPLSGVRVGAVGLRGRRGPQYSTVVVDTGSRDALPYHNIKHFLLVLKALK